MKKDANTQEVIMNPNDHDFIILSPGQLLIKHSIPAVVSMLFMAFYQIADGMLVGRRLGPDALASVNILYPIIALAAGLAVMIGVGGNTRMAILLGEGKIKNANRVFGLVMVLGASLGFFLSLLTFFGMPYIMSFLGSSGQMGVFASAYLRQLLPFFTSMIFMFILSQAVRNDGQPVLASVVMAGAALLNILLDYCFLFILDMGIAGAAIATGLAQSAGSLVFLLYFLKKKMRSSSGLLISRPGFKLDWLKAIVLNGSSELFNSLAAGVTTFLFNRMILLHVGSLGIAAFTLVQYLLMLGMAFVMGIGNGIQPLISYNYGARLFKRAKSIALLASAASTTAGIIIFFIMSWQTTPITALFLPGETDALILTAEVAGYVRWSVIFMPLAMLGSICFTAIEQAGKSLLLAIMRSLFLPVVLLAVLPARFSAAGIWITPLLTEALTMLVVIWMAIIVNRSMTRQQKQLPQSAVSDVYLGGYDEPVIL